MVLASAFSFLSCRMCVLSMSKSCWIEWEKKLSPESKEFLHCCLFARPETEHKRSIATKNHSTVIHGDFHCANIIPGENKDGALLSQLDPVVASSSLKTLD